MIRNDQQLAVARRKLHDLERDLETIDGADARHSYAILAGDLRAEIDVYERIHDGRTVRFAVRSLDALPDALVAARIARRLTQRELAAGLGVSEQQVQKWEDGGYERAQLPTLADVAEALGYTLTGALEPASERPIGDDASREPGLKNAG